MEIQVKVGAWTAYKTQISKEEMNVFKQAVNLVGVEYTPIAVSTQIVAGTNYRFFCNAQGVYPGATPEGAIVQIYQPLEGKAHITSITKCH